MDVKRPLLTRVLSHTDKEDDGAQSRKRKKKSAKQKKQVETIQQKRKNSPARAPVICDNTQEGQGC
jgi:hypothetical protein